MPLRFSFSACVAAIVFSSLPALSQAGAWDSQHLLQHGESAALGAEQILTAEVERRGTALTLTIEQFVEDGAPLVARLPFAGDGQRHRLILRGDDDEEVRDLVLEAVRRGDAISLTAGTEGEVAAFQAAMR